jgi:predicted nucleotide-binding protein
MKTLDYSGYWTGKIEGTNHGGFTLDIKQDDNEITGIAKFSEPELGQYEYFVKGLVDDPLSLQLIPNIQRGGVNIGKAQVLASMNNEGNLVGRWKTEIGTEGILTAKRTDFKSHTTELPKSNSVFLVHGHDDGVKHSVARFLEQLGVTPVILQEQINKGMTVIEKFEDFAARAGFAIVLMTPDDFGYQVGKEEEKKHRPRQNVVLELGYFAAHLGRSKTFVLVKGEIEMPSDVLGLVYESLDKNEGWKIRLARELKAAGFEIDLNKAIT